MKRISFLVLLILVPFFTKAQEVVLSRDFGSGSVRLERKTDNQSFRQNRDGSRFYKTSFTIKVNLGDLNRSNEITDIYTDNGTAMEPCMLIDTENKLLYIFILSKSTDKMYGMDGIVSRLDMNSGKLTRENVFNNSNWGWYAYFRGSENGNIELWHFAYSGYANMCSTRNNNNGVWSSANKGSSSPDKAANQRSSFDHILVIKSSNGTMVAEQKKSASQPIANNNSSNNTQNQNSANNNMSSGSAAQDNKHFDFSAVCSSGQTLYYEILDDQDKNRLQIQKSVNAVWVKYPYMEHIKNSVTSYYVWGYKGYTKPTGNVVIPSKVTNNGISYTVVAIHSSAFEECENMESATIPSTVVSIGNEAFKGCRKLKSVVIPNSVKEIEWGAFHYCSALKSINIPNSVKKIRHNAFEESGLKSIQFPSAMTEFGDHICCKCKDLESVVLPTNLQEIPYSAFYECQSLRSITIPSSVKKIKNGAFYCCYSLSIKVPNTVTYVGDYGDAFKNCLNVIYNGKLKEAPWGAKCLNGYVEGDCVYKDKTKKTLVYCKPSEDAKVANKPSNSGNSASKARNRFEELHDYIICCGGTPPYTLGAWNGSKAKITIMAPSIRFRDWEIEYRDLTKDYLIFGYGRGNTIDETVRAATWSYREFKKNYYNCDECIIDLVDFLEKNKNGKWWNGDR